jgi:hypothetical protein
MNISARSNFALDHFVPLNKPVQQFISGYFIIIPDFTFCAGIL